MELVLPNFLVVGAAKSGTTAIYHYLRQHPEIFMPRIKEPQYFINHEYNLNYRGGINNYEAYLDLFKEADGKKAIGEASTPYLFWEESPKLIKNTLGMVRIIIILRNPAVRAFSLYVWMAREGFEDAKTFDEALERESKRCHDINFWYYNPEYAPDYFYFLTGKYYEQVKRYLDLFGREFVRVYLYEDFAKDPLGICSDIFDFLGVDRTFQPSTGIHNPGWLPRSIPLQFWLRTKAFQSFWLRAAPGRYRYRLWKMLFGFNLKVGRTPIRDENITKMLTEKYYNDIKELENLLKRDLSLWYRNLNG
jgi:hypothetical protein